MFWPVAQTLKKDDKSVSVVENNPAQAVEFH